MTDDDRDTYLLTFKTTCSLGWLKHTLKRLGRSYGLRCVRIEAQADPAPNAPGAVQTPAKNNPTQAVKISGAR